MKAAVLRGSNKIHYQEVEDPEVGEGELKIKVKVAGICGSDLPRVLGDGAHFYPIILGHEFAGEVVEVGPGADGHAAGDRVAVAPLVPCHICADCRTGHFAQCGDYSFIGSRRSGGWAEYVTVPEENVVRLPQGADWQEGAFFEPAAVALHSLLVMDFRGAQDVAIIGMGTIGLLVLQWSKILGAKRIFAFDIDERCLALACDYGADFCLSTRDEEFREIVEKETCGRGFGQVIEAAGVEYTEKLTLEIAENRGKIMFVGTPTSDLTLSPEEFEYINRKELTIRGSWMSYSAPFPGREWDLTAHYLAAGDLNIRPLIARTFSLSQIEEAFRMIAAGDVSGKVLLTDD